jgi:predicted nucleic acid-binding protein
VLIDSSAFFALIYSRETNHPAARAIAQVLDAERWQLVTTNFIRAESHALILNRAGHAVADRFLADLRDRTPIRIVRVTEADEERALALVAQYRDKDFTLTDATSFVIMERVGIRTAFTFDDDFRQYGFIVL